MKKGFDYYFILKIIGLFLGLFLIINALSEPKPESLVIFLIGLFFFNKEILGIARK